MYMDGFIHLGIGYKAMSQYPPTNSPNRSPRFSLNFSSADKGLFIAVEAKNIHQRCTFLGAGGQWSVGHGPALAGILGAKFSELHSLILRLSLCKSAMVTFTQQFKMESIQKLHKLNAFFFTFFKGYRGNYLSVITPNTICNWSLRKYDTYVQ